MIEYKVRVYSDGDKYWYLDGKRHREDGPAIELSSGSKHWYLNGKLHREDGPAVEFSRGGKQWYIKGVNYTKEEYKIKMGLTPCSKRVTIDGVEYELKEVK